MSYSIPKGYRFAGVHCGIKRNPLKKDLMLVVSDQPASAVGVFTTNRVQAAPVKLCRERLPSTTIRGLIVNSGNANACTGRAGDVDAQTMARLLADRIGVNDTQVLVSSTGVIGRALPMEKIAAGTEIAARQLGATVDSVHDAAAGIMTTDTRIKVISRTVQTTGGPVTLLGIAKGAAMIGPNMATMLAFVLTDAWLAPAQLKPALRAAVDVSFHCTSVEGHTSTNDTVLVLANGASGMTINPARMDEFSVALTDVCEHLARSIIDDAEGISHFITIHVRGAQSDSDAKRIAKTIADSALVKTAIFGNDPNWGRIVSAAGYSGVEFREEEVSLKLNGQQLYRFGAPTEFDPTVISVNMRDQRDTLIELELQSGSGECRFWTSDLTTQYVHINADYTT